MAIITRRSILRGLFAAPAVVVASRLMPVRGVVLRPYTLSWRQKNGSGAWHDQTRELLLAGDYIGAQELASQEMRRILSGHAAAWEAVALSV